MVKVVVIILKKYSFRLNSENIETKKIQKRNGKNKKIESFTIFKIDFSYKIVPQ